MEEIASRLRETVEANERERHGQKISQHEREDVEKKFILSYAIENHLWINDIYSLGNATGIQGNENTLVVDVANNIVYKSNNLFNEEYIVSDLHPRNVLKDANGVIYVVDDIVIMK